MKGRGKRDSTPSVYRLYNRRTASWNNQRKHRLPNPPAVKHFHVGPNDSDVPIHQRRSTLGSLELLAYKEKQIGNISIWGEREREEESSAVMWRIVGSYWLY
jgi:hypothetical protein